MDDVFEKEEGERLRNNPEWIRLEAGRARILDERMTLWWRKTNRGLVDARRQKAARGPRQGSQSAHASGNRRPAEGGASEHRGAMEAGGKGAPPQAGSPACPKGALAGAGDVRTLAGEERTLKWTEGGKGKPNHVLAALDWRDKATWLDWRRRGWPSGWRREGLAIMPTILRIGGFRLYFYSHEPDEPPHVHVDRGSASAKFWLENIAPARNAGFSAKELGEVQRLVLEHQEQLLEAWHVFFGPRH